jgi:hypothetical protein
MRLYFTATSAQYRQPHTCTPAVQSKTPDALRYTVRAFLATPAIDCQFLWSPLSPLITVHITVLHKGCHSDHPSYARQGALFKLA